jgi:hypothetical protein
MGEQARLFNIRLFPSPCGVRRVGDETSLNPGSWVSTVSVPLRGKEGGGPTDYGRLLPRVLSTVSVPLRGKEGGGRKKLPWESRHVCSTFVCFRPLAG